MNRAEARAVLAEKLAAYRDVAYADLARRVNTVETAEVTASSTYNLEFQFLWDGKPDQDIRVMGSIDDGGLRAFFPLTDDFIMAPDGTFVGE